MLTRNVKRPPTLITLQVRQTTPIWWTFAHWTVGDGFANCILTTGIIDSARIEALVLNARLVVGTFRIMFTLSLFGCELTDKSQVKISSHL